MSKTPAHLQKVLADLALNRSKLKEAMDQHDLQHGINVEQLEHFDTLIASVQHSLGSDAAITAIDALKAAAPAETPASSLDAAGAGAQTAPAPAG